VALDDMLRPLGSVEYNFAWWHLGNAR